MTGLDPILVRLLLEGTVLENSGIPLGGRLIPRRGRRITKVHVREFRSFATDAFNIVVECEDSTIAAILRKQDSLPSSK